MRRLVAGSLAILFSLQVWSEYPELEALRRTSRESLAKTATRLRFVDIKFVGVINFGEAIVAEDPGRPRSAEELTVHNQDYWRALMEMAPSDPSVLFAHGYLLGREGEADKAHIFMSLGAMGLSESFRPELANWQECYGALFKKKEAELAKGIKLNDAGKFKKALAVYDGVLANYPNCATAMYEKALTLLLMDPKSALTENKRAEMYAFCRQHSPFMWEAYQGSDQKVLQGLSAFLKKVHPYYSGEDRSIASFVAFSQGCEEMGLYSIAAVCEWKLALLDGQNQKKHLKRYLLLMEQSGCPNVKFFRDQFTLEDDGNDVQANTGEKAK